MANLSSPRHLFFYAFQLLILTQAKVYCYWYKVGDLDCWNIPSSAKPDVYGKWSKTHIFRVGDSLLFLYPPSQDSVLQVTPTGYKNCNLKNPMLHLNDGNSLFNITKPGEYYFISGEPGHCQKGQKLHVSLPGDGAIAYPPDYNPDAMPDVAAGPSYQNVFGSIPHPSNSASTLTRFSAFFAPFIGLAVWAIA